MVPVVTTCSFNSKVAKCEASSMDARISVISLFIETWNIGLLQKQLSGFAIQIPGYRQKLQDIEFWVLDSPRRHLKRNLNMLCYLILHCIPGCLPIMSSFWWHPWLRKNACLARFLQDNHEKCKSCKILTEKANLARI